ncbi:MAG: dihydrofolate reductase [Leptothrix sp. (in: b-proteobacteria)]
MNTATRFDPARPELVLIAAVAEDGVIGLDNRLPWHLPEDLQHFKRQTLGCPVLMGRKTWDSLPARFRPLPGRINVVLTRQPDWQAEGALRAASLDDALAQLAGQPRVFVIGGAELYAQALPQADRLVLTEIEARLSGDAHFPPWDRTQFAEVTRERHHAASNDFDFSFVTYQRIR